MNLTQILLTLLIICIVITLPVIFNFNRIETLNYHYPEYPFWNSTRQTTNMSYDVRGDIPIPKTFISIWNKSPRAPPIVNRPLWAVS